MHAGIWPSHCASGVPHAASSGEPSSPSAGGPGAPLTAGWRGSCQGPCPSRTYTRAAGWGIAVCMSISPGPAFCWTHAALPVAGLSLNRHPRVLHDLIHGDAVLLHLVEARLGALGVAVATLSGELAVGVLSADQQRDTGKRERGAPVILSARAHAAVALVVALEGLRGRPGAGAHRGVRSACSRTARARRVCAR